MQNISDQNIERTIGQFIRKKRQQQNLTQSETAFQANISRSTLSLLERGETVSLATLIKVLRVLNQLQILSIFEENETLSPIALAKLAKRERQRVRN